MLFKVNVRASRPLPVVEAANDHGVPQGVHLTAAVVHNSGEPRVHGLGAVVVAVPEQLLIDAGRSKAKLSYYLTPFFCPLTLSAHQDSCLHHLLDDLLEVLVVGVVARSTKDGAVVHLKKNNKISLE